MKELLKSEYIKDILQEQYNYCISEYGEKNVLGIFIYGNINYNMGFEEKDIHSEMIYIPTFDELCLSSNPLPQSIIYKNHIIKIMDARNIYTAIFKGRLELAEALYTDYYIINPRYKYVFENFFKTQRDVIVQHNKGMRIKQAATIGLNAINKYSITLNPYQAYKALRALHFCESYSTNQLFESCISVPDNKKEWYYNVRFDEDAIINKGEFIETTILRLKRFEYVSDEVEALPAYSEKTLKNAILTVMKKAMDKTNTAKFLSELTPGEKKALQAIFSSINLSGEVSVSKLVAETKGASRQVFSTLFGKMKNQEVATVENRGVRGTAITFLDENIIDMYYKGEI